MLARAPLSQIVTDQAGRSRTRSAPANPAQRRYGMLRLRRCSRCRARRARDVESARRAILEQAGELVESTGSMRSERAAERSTPSSSTGNRPSAARGSRRRPRRCSTRCTTIRSSRVEHEAWPSSRTAARNQDVQGAGRWSLAVTGRRRRDVERDRVGRRCGELAQLALAPPTNGPRLSRRAGSCSAASGRRVEASATKSSSSSIWSARLKLRARSRSSRTPWSSCPCRRATRDMAGRDLDRRPELEQAGGAVEEPFARPLSPRLARSGRAASPTKRRVAGEHEPGLVGACAIR